MWEVFLLPYTLLHWTFQYFFSGVVWFTLFGFIHFYLNNKFTWKLQNPFRNIWTRNKKYKGDLNDPEDWV